MPFGDREMLDDLLNDEKEILKLYSTGLAESSDLTMRQVILKNMQQADQDQYDVFDKMRTLGYYQTKPANQNDVVQTKQIYQQIQKQL